VRNIPKAAGVPPALERDRLEWRSFLREHAAATFACDFLTVDTVLLRRLCVLVFICIGSQPELDYGGKRNPDGQGFAAFGMVTRGMAVVRKIQKMHAKGQILTPPVTIQQIRAR